MKKFAVSVLIDETFPKYDRVEQERHGENLVVRLYLKDVLVTEFSMSAGTSIATRTRVDVYFEEAEDERAAARQAVDRIPLRVLSAVARPIP